MYLESLKDCQLRIGNYPAFIYDASGGGGIGTLLPLPVEGNYRITFKKKLYICFWTDYGSNIAALYAGQVFF